MLIIGCIGVVVIYAGFFYLSFSEQTQLTLPWYILLSPWICVFFGLEQHQQLSVLNWFSRKLLKPTAR
ncbi:hypothetical protein [Shewanella gelidii]|nr:hypothetical protein [Shewanella gelidii]MCL1097377.1 hypothetical protein [Shewanella gelidii]